MITFSAIFGVLPPETFVTIFYNGHCVFSDYVREFTPKLERKYSKCRVVNMRALPDDQYMIHIV